MTVKANEKLEWEIRQWITQGGDPSMIFDIIGTLFDEGKNPEDKSAAKFCWDSAEHLRRIVS